MPVSADVSEFLGEDEMSDRPEDFTGDDIREDTPILSFYEPIPDNPPTIFGTGRAPLDDSENGNGSSGEKSITPEESSEVICVESSNPAKDSTED
jgi:hypothetical protein